MTATDVCFGVLVAAAWMLLAGVSGMMAQFHASDAAGQGMTQAFAFFADIAFWIVLLVLALLSMSRDGVPGAMGLVVFALFIACAFSSVSTVIVLQKMPAGAKYEYLFRASVIASSVLAVLVCLWGYVPLIRSAIPPAAAVVALLLPLAAAAAIPAAFRSSARQAAAAKDDEAVSRYRDAAARRDALLAEIKALPEASPIAAFLPYTEIAPERISPDPAQTPMAGEVRQAAILRISKSPRRQDEVVADLNRGDVRLLGLLQDLDLKYSPELCAAGKKAARRFIAEIEPKDPARPFDDPGDRISFRFTNLCWLARNGCDFKAEVGDLERAVRRYPETSPREFFLTYIESAKGKLGY
jgi:hypothetical protein